MTNNYNFNVTRYHSTIIICTKEDVNEYRFFADNDITTMKIIARIITCTFRLMIVYAIAVYLGVFVW